MITLYTPRVVLHVRKARTWLEGTNIQYLEKNII